MPTVSFICSSARWLLLESRFIVAVAGSLFFGLTAYDSDSHDSDHSCDELKTIIEEFQKCHLDHPIAKFLGECTELKIKLDRCFRQEKALKRKANFEQSKKLKERLQALRKETAENDS
ncbi:hypothetical protein DITRI_Ditri05aG0049700 [Diplodiscus trichospermus]